MSPRKSMTVEMIERGTPFSFTAARVLFVLGLIAFIAALFAPAMWYAFGVAAVLWIIFRTRVQLALSETRMNGLG